MVNVANPNFKCNSAVKTRRANIKKIQRKKAALPKDKALRADTTRGARPGLMPTSGPRAPLSGKRARKEEKKLAYAIRRRMEAEGEVEMKGEFFFVFHFLSRPGKGGRERFC